VLLCLFELGIRFAVEAALSLFRIDLRILYDLIFLGITLVIARQFGTKEIPALMKWRKIPGTVFCSLIVMFSGMELLRREASNALYALIPAPEGFWQTGRAGVMMTVISGALFPAVTEELFFRGILLRRLRLQYTKHKALAASALLFGLMHLNPWQTLTAFISGLFYGWIYITYRTIWPCIFFHAYNNVLASFMVIPAAHSLLLIALGAALFLGGWGLSMAVSGRAAGT
jgi:membrane protease YdiL (CAAX protease family)